MKEQREMIAQIEKKGCEVAIAEHFGVEPVKDVVLSDDLFRDVEFWNNVFPHIDKTVLKGGQHFLKGLLQAPSKDFEILELRKSLIKGVEDHMSDEDGSKFTMEGGESAVVWALTEVEENMKDMYDMVYFKLYVTRRLNDSPEAISTLNIYRILFSPLVGIISPILYFVVPYMVIRIKFGLDISFISYLKMMYNVAMNSGGMMFGLGGGDKFKFIQKASYLFSLVFYFTGVFNSVEIARTLYKISKHLTEKMNLVAGFLRNALELIGKYWKDDMGKAFGCEGCLVGMEEEVKYVERLASGKFSVFGNFGRQLHSYRHLDKRIVKSICAKVYVLDAIWGLIKMRREYGYGYAEFVDREAPMVKLLGMRHPSIDIGKCVANDVSLIGGQNMIITGTNAGGKSVTIKGLILNVLMAQTCCIGCADVVVLTPLASVNAQINVPDATGHESLFEAEMHRCKRNLEGLCVNQKSMIIMDEIFSSTNPLEAISGAYAVCKKMASYPNNLLVFTTHFNYLTKLKKTGKFVNYKMDTRVGEDGEIEFTYKLVPGVNKHYLALELLKKNGFDSDIIEDALEIKKKLSN